MEITMSRELMEMGYKAIREAVAGFNPFNKNGLRKSKTQNYSQEYLNKRVLDYDSDYIGPSKDNSVVPYSMTDTAPVRFGDIGMGRDQMNKANKQYFNIGIPPQSATGGIKGINRTSIGKGSIKR